MFESHGELSDLITTRATTSILRGRLWLADDGLQNSWTLSVETADWVCFMRPEWPQREQEKTCLHSLESLLPGVWW